MKMEVVLNRCYGGFNLSPEALLWLYERGCKTIAMKATECFGKHTNDLIKAKEDWKQYLEDKKEKWSINVFSPDMEYILSSHRSDKNFRCDPLLVECVKTLGKKANGSCAELAVIEVDVSWNIGEYDGIEHVEIYRCEYPY